MLDTTSRYSFTASVPCVGWQENRGAPLLVGSVTSSSTGLIRTEGLHIGTACGASPCTVTRTTGGWNGTVTRTSAGVYPVAINAGQFSEAPICTATISQTGAGALSNQWIIQVTDMSTTSVTVRTFNNTGVATDIPFSLQCIGQR